MNFRFLSFLKYTLLAAVVLSLVVVSGCDDDDGPSVDPRSVVEFLSDERFQESATVPADQALDSLVKYLTTYPELTGALGGSSKVTLFAPSNAAFKTLLQTPGFPQDIRDINPAIIEGVLSYHIVSDELLKAELTPTGTGAGINTMYSSTDPCSGAQTVQVVKVNDDGTLLTGSTNTAIDILKSEQASNGVVHVTEAVLIPPSVGASLTPILGKVAATVLLGSDFSHLATAMTIADCGVSGVTPLAAILAGPGPYTVFLPPNPVFDGTAATLGVTVEQFIGSFTPAQWRNIILNHIVSGSSNNNAALVNGFEMTTMQSANATLTVAAGGAQGAPPLSPIGKYLTTSGGATGLGGTQNSPIWQPDITNSNGVVHVVGKILIPN